MALESACATWTATATTARTLSRSSGASRTYRASPSSTWTTATPTISGGWWRASKLAHSTCWIQHRRQSRAHSVTKLASTIRAGAFCTSACTESFDPVKDDRQELRGLDASVGAHDDPDEP